MSGLLAAAIRYANAGISVIPCKGKAPSVGWESAQTRQASIGQIQGWDAAGYLQNIGVVCGHVSGGLVVIDCDGLEAVNLFKREFGYLADQTLAITTGSRKGAHYWFYSPIPVPTVRAVGIPNVGNIELRSDKTYVIAPPSIHPETKLPYIVRRSVKPARVSLTLVSQWIESLKPGKMSGQAAPNGTSGGAGHTSDHAAGTVSSAAGIRDRNAYGRAALESEIDELKTVTTAQNEAIYRAALKMGSHIRDGNLTRHFVEMALYNAAREIGYVARDGDLHVWSTIHSGLNTGEGNSRDENTSRQRA
jgi:hypothetical protein